MKMHSDTHEQIKWKCDHDTNIEKMKLEIMNFLFGEISDLKKIKEAIQYLSKYEPTILNHISKSLINNKRVFESYENDQCSEIMKLLQEDKTSSIDHNPEFSTHVTNCNQCSLVNVTLNEDFEKTEEKWEQFADQLQKIDYYKKDNKKQFIMGYILMFFSTYSKYLWTKQSASLFVIVGVLVSFYYFGFLQYNKSEPSYLFKGNSETKFTLAINNTIIGPLKDTINCSAGDTVSFILRSPQSVFYSILYSDDNKPIEIYIPGTEYNSNKETGKPSGGYIPDAVVLDSLWQFEMLYFVWSLTPFSSEEAISFAESSQNGTTQKNIDMFISTKVLVRK